MRAHLFLVGGLFLIGCSGRAASAPPDRPLAQAAAPAAAAAATPTATGDLPGIDLSDLPESDRTAFQHLVDKFPSACGKAHSLAVSVRTDPRCRRSVYAARYVARLLRAHLLESEVEEKYEKRFSEKPRLDIDVKEAPARGVPGAPVTLVEFADFQCPHCKHEALVLERLLEDYSGKVRLVFKNFPITHSHPYAQIAAQAALAAGKQGKFWPFHDRLFHGDQEKEAMPDLEKIAKDLKLDVKKWKGDIDGTKDQVARDRAEGERVEVEATPTLYINGRKFSGPPTEEEIKDWIDEELNK